MLAYTFCTMTQTIQFTSLANVTETTTERVPAALLSFEQYVAELVKAERITATPSNPPSGKGSDRETVRVSA